MKLPKIIGDTWFNSKPLKPEDLSGKVVLIDFWTYSCVNCQRTLPYLKEWWGKYQKMNFIMIGIHTPEFEFEKDPKNVQNAIKDLGIEWPVVLDNDYVDWNNFGNHYWPAKYLADKSGEIIYTHFGEGSYGKTEAEIQKLFKEMSPSASMPKLVSETHQHGAVCFIATPELYCGYERGRLSNPEGYQRDKVFNYQEPGKIKDDTIALSGKFLATPQYVESKGENSKLLLHFRATEVNLVLHPKGKNAVVEVTFNGKPLPSEIKGENVDGSGQVTIEKPTLYNLLSNNLTEGTLAITARKGDFQSYAFTFSGCE